MYKVVFYEDSQGHSELYEQILELAAKSKNNKDARIQHKQIFFYIELLKNQGSNLPTNISKHLQENIYELRPGNNRVLYFFYINDTYVLLHMFRKKTQKTPKSETEKAIKERNDFLKRKGGGQKWELGKTTKKKQRG